MPALPFDQTVEIREAPSGDLLDIVEGRIWPSDGSSVNSRGANYDATGELDPEAAPFLVGEGNRRLVCEGTTYNVISAVEHEFLPHVSVTLSELRPGG